MERLTKRDTKDGLAYTEIALNTSCIYDDVKQRFHACHTGFIADRLAAYEDTGLDPEQILQNEELFKAYHHVYGGRHPHEIVKALELLDLEEQGRLIKLPCKLGSTVYSLNQYDDGTFEDEIYEDEAYSISISQNKDGEILYDIDCSEYKLNDFGKTAFLTKEEAEKVLEVMNEN